jgi:hypothetical protein
MDVINLNDRSTECLQTLVACAHLQSCEGGGSRPGQSWAVDDSNSKSDERPMHVPTNHSNVVMLNYRPSIQVLMLFMDFFFTFNNSQIF